MILYYYCFGALALSFLICFFVTRRGIGWLKKLHMGQKILEIGPNWHKAKEGTPTMGGLFFSLVSIGASLLLGLIAALYGNRAGVFADALCVLVFLLLHGLVGFADDYVKFIRHRNKGLTALQKLVFQFAITGAFLFCMHSLGHTSTALRIPFTDLFRDLDDPPCRRGGGRVLAHHPDRRAFGRGLSFLMLQPAPREALYGRHGFIVFGRGAHGDRLLV